MTLMFRTPGCLLVILDGVSPRGLSVLLLFLVFNGGVSNVSAAEPEPQKDSSNSKIDFARDIGPILVEHCLKCHQPGNAKGDLSLESSEGLKASNYVVPGKPDESHLISVVRSDEPSKPPQMPEKGEPLSNDQVELLVRWVTQGAEWPEGVKLSEPTKSDRNWWAYLPLSKAPPPQQTPGISTAWQINPIDQFIYARLAAEGLSPSAPADKRTLIRRVTYDLTGLPPTPEEIESFVKDESPDAYAKLVDRLLDSPRYGEHWGRHWMDVIRFGESRGYERNEIITNAWPFRDYVIRSFNEDKPYDRLVLEHLAGDIIGKNDPAVEIGATFLVCGPYDDVGNQDAVQAAQIRANTIDDIIRATGETFLGVTIGCARCHNHKFDPLTQSDYYSLYATFAGVFHGSREVSTVERRQQRDEQIGLFTKTRDDLIARRAKLLDGILARANANIACYESAWIRPGIQRTGVEEIFEPVKARFVRLKVEGTDANPEAATGYRIDEFEVFSAEEKERNVALASAGAKADGAYRQAEDFAEAYSVKQTIDGKYGARWISAGPNLTIEFAQEESIRRILFSSDRNGEALGNPVATFITEYRLEISSDGKEWKEITNSRNRKPINDAHRRHRLLQLESTDEEQKEMADLDKELAETNAKLAAVPPLDNWWVGNFQPAPGPFHVFLGGNPQKPGDAVFPSSLSPLANVTPKYQLSLDHPEGERRIALARWLTDAKNPLTPRVLVNRIWQYHFGTGILDTTSDFGYMGGRPTHPELLDWLAVRLLEEKWHIKPLHRLMVLSQTYQQAGDYRPDAASKDADSRLLWRFPPRRLSAEEIRDTILSISGKMDFRMGGPGFRLYRYLQDNVATYIPLDNPGPDTYRRAVYHHNARASRLDLMTDFDCPDNAFAAPRRGATTTPLQALTLLNHPFIFDMANFWSDRLRAEVGEENLSEQIRRAFLLAYGREPRQDESTACLELARSRGMRAVCRALLNSSELIYLD